MSRAFCLLDPYKAALPRLQHTWVRERHIASFQGISVEADALLVDQSFGLASTGCQAGLQQHIHDASARLQSKLLHFFRRFFCWNSLTNAFSATFASASP